MLDHADLPQGPPEEAHSGLFVVHGPGLHPKVLQVEGHRCEDGLAAERSNRGTHRIICTSILREYMLNIYFTKVHNLKHTNNAGILYLCMYIGYVNFLKQMHESLKSIQWKQDYLVQQREH